MRADNRKAHADIAAIVDSIRKHMDIEHITFPYYPEPWEYWWIPAPTVKRKKKR